MTREGRPLLFDTPEALDKAIDEYFESCKAHYDYAEAWEDAPRKRGKLQFEKDGITVVQVQIRRRVYIEAKTPRITDLAVYLNTSRRTLLNYKDREEFFPSIKRALDRVEAATEAQLDSGKSVAGAIFNLINIFGQGDKDGTLGGWANRQDITSGGEKLAGNTLSPEAAAVLDKANGKK